MDPKNPDFQAMMQNLLQNAQKMQENMHLAYQQMIEKNKNNTVTGKAGGDLITAHVDYKMNLTKLDLKPELFQEEHAVISELIVGAVNSAFASAQAEVKREMTEISKQMGIPSQFPFPFGDKG